MTVNGVAVPVSHLAYLSPSRSRVAVTAATPTRIVLLGGEPLGEQIVMWWNFIGRTHDEVAGHRREWMEQVEGGMSDGRFGLVDTDLEPIPAPTLPNVRLKERR